MFELNKLDGLFDELDEVLLQHKKRMGPAKETADGTMRVGSLVYMCAGDDTPLPDPHYSPVGELTGVITAINDASDGVNGASPSYESAVVFAEAFPEHKPPFRGCYASDTHNHRTILTTYLLPVLAAGLAS